MSTRPERALDGRPILVAGAGGGGIGTAVCRAIAAAGGTVVAIDLTELGRQVAADALAEAGGDHLVLEADLTDPTSVGAAIDRATAAAGPLRGSVNVVGGMRAHHWAALDAPDALEVIDEVMAFNLRPPLVAGRAVAQAMRDHGVAGSIVNVASVVGLVSMPFGAGYAAAKAALINLTRTMAVEWGRDQIRVNAVAPGTIQVDRIGRERFDGDAQGAGRAIAAAVPLGRRGEAPEIAGPAVFLLSDQSSYVTGHTLVVDGGATCRPAYNDEDDLPVFSTDASLRARLLGGR